MEAMVEKETNKLNDVFDKKLQEADAAIESGARFYTREEADKIFNLLLKKGI